MILQTIFLEFYCNTSSDHASIRPLLWIYGQCNHVLLQFSPPQVAPGGYPSGTGTRLMPRSSNGGGPGPVGGQQLPPGAGSALMAHSLARRASPNSSSQYSQHWRMKKDLGGRCSWKFVAIFFILLSVILVSALTYTTGKEERELQL